MRSKVPVARRGRWMKHDGYGIPEGANGPVDVEFRDGDIASYQDGESLGGWDHEGHEHDVVMWRSRADRISVTPPRDLRTKLGDA